MSRTQLICLPWWAVFGFRLSATQWVGEVLEELIEDLGLQSWGKGPCRVWGVHLGGCPWELGGGQWGITARGGEGRESWYMGAWLECQEPVGLGQLLFLLPSSSSSSFQLP